MGTDVESSSGADRSDPKRSKDRQTKLMYVAFAYYVGLILVVFRGPTEPTTNTPTNLEIAGILVLVVVWFAAIGVIVNFSNVIVALATCLTVWTIAFGLMEPEFEDDDYLGQALVAVLGIFNTLLFLIAFAMKALVEHLGSRTDAPESDE